MRRFNYELKIIENEAKKISYQEMSNIFHYVKSIYGNTVPTNNDLQGAARALIRLQVMYRYRYMSIYHGKYLETNNVSSLKNFVFKHLNCFLDSM